MAEESIQEEGMQSLEENSDKTKTSAPNSVTSENKNTHPTKGDSKNCTLLEECVKLLFANHNLILTGAPGTGKTHLAKEIASKIVMPTNINYEIITNYINTPGLSIYNPYNRAPFTIKYAETKNVVINKDENNKAKGFMPFIPFNKIISAFTNQTWQDKTALKPKDSYASAIAQYIYNQIKENITFVQIHPSYDYSDFVEGLRPIDSNGSMIFKRENGIFKNFCTKAINNHYNSAPNNSFEINYYNLIESIKKAPLEFQDFNGSTKKIIVINDELSYSTETNKQPSKYIDYEYLQILYNYFIEQNIKEVDILTKNYYKDLIYDLTNGKITSIDYIYYRVILQKLIDSNKNKELINRFVFIIDEINRGEISKIFGELFFSIDPGYRGKSGLVQTQYQNLITDENDPFKDGFYVPENVYIIGTMNDIDRSVESMDFAMRRRFAWKEINAEENLGMLDSLSKFNSSIYPNLRNDIETIMKKLNNKISNIEGLGSAYHIGGAYFAKIGKYLDSQQNNYKDAKEELWEYHIKGVLYEYLRGSADIEKTMDDLKNAYDGKDSNV